MGVLKYERALRPVVGSELNDKRFLTERPKKVGHEIAGCNGRELANVSEQNHLFERTRFYKDPDEVREQLQKV